MVVATWDGTIAIESYRICFISIKELRNEHDSQKNRRVSSLEAARTEHHGGDARDGADARAGANDGDAADDRDGAAGTSIQQDVTSPSEMEMAENEPEGQKKEKIP
jgi:hypothetical protein